VLAARLATAVVLIAGLLAALFYLPSVWLKLVIGAVVALAAFEWGRLCRLDAYRYAGLLVAAYGIALWIRSDVVFALAAAFWVVAVPFWLWRGVEARQARLLAAAGLFVLIPAGLAVVALPAAAGLARARADLGRRYGGLLRRQPVGTPQARAVDQPVKDVGGRCRRAARDPELRYHLRSIRAATG